VIALHAGLSQERRLQVGSGLKLTDGGAGGDITVGLDLAYGSISATNSVTATTLNSAAKVQITNFDTNGDANNAVPDHTNDHITINRAGKYLCTFVSTVENSAGAAHKIDVSVWKNNGATRFDTTHIHHDLGAGSDVVSIATSAILDLAVNDTIEVWALTDRAVDSDVIFEDVVLTLVQIG